MNWLVNLLMWLVVNLLFRRVIGILQGSNWIDCGLYFEFVNNVDTQVTNWSFYILGSVTFPVDMNFLLYYFVWIDLFYPE